MKLLMLCALYYVGVLCNPIQFALADLMQPPVSNNAYSPYSMYERCHPAEFNIPNERKC